MARPQTEVRSVDRLPVTTKALWGVGSLAVGAVVSPVTSQFMVYLTDQIGIAPVVAGGILFAAKIYDLFTDIAVGLASDRFNTRWGRRRPWMFVGALVTAAICPLIFHLDRFDPALTTVLATVFLLIFHVGHTAFAIPHLAMSAEMTQSYQERTSLASFMYFFGAMSFFCGVALAPLFIGLGGEGLDGFHLMSWIMALFPLVLGMLCVWGTRNAPTLPREARPPIRIRDWLGSVAQNRPMLVLMGTKMLHFFGAACFTGALVYYTLHVLRFGQYGMVLAGFCMSSGSIAGLYFFVRLSRTLEKHTIYALALVGMSLAAWLFTLLGPESSRVLFGAVCFIWGVIGAALVMAHSMLADVMHWDRHLSGLRREGAVSSLVNSIGKITPAFSSLAVGALLSANGYLAGKGGMPQPESAIRAIYWSVAVIPSVMFAAAAALLFFGYDLTRAKMDKLRTDGSLDIAD